MSDPDVFLTLAEVAVAFAGFASLVGILGRRASVDDQRVLGVRMRAMILASLLVVGFSLFPVLMDRYGASPVVIWRTSDLALLGATGVYLGWIVVTFRALGRAVTPNRFQRVLILPILVLTFSTLAVLLVVNAVLASPAVYLTALALLLLQAGFAFSLIVFSFLPRVGGRPGPVADDQG